MTKSFSACYFEASLSLCIELIPRGARNLSMSQNCISHNLWRHGFFQTSTFSTAIFPTFNTQVTDPFLGKMNVGSQNGYSNNMGNYRPPLIWLFMLFPPTAHIFEEHLMALCFLVKCCGTLRTFFLFSRILKTSINTFLQSDDDNLQRNMSECAKMVCHGQHTYVYAQVKLKSTRPRIFRWNLSLP